MKLAARFLSLTVLAALALFYMSCGGDNGNDKSDIDIQIEKLNGRWNADIVTYKGSAPALNHDNFEITVSGSAGNNTLTYTITGRPQGPSAWPASGTLTFGTNVKQDLVRDDDVAISYSVSDTRLILDFNFEGNPYAASRVSNVGGEWHFELVKVQ